MKPRKRPTIYLESPIGKTSKFTVPYAVAWITARAIAQHSHNEVCMSGEHATAKFNSDGTCEMTYKTTKETVLYDKTTTGLI